MTSGQRNGDDASTTLAPRQRAGAQLAALEARSRELTEALVAARDRADRLQAQLDIEHATKLGRAVVLIRRAVLRLLPVGSARRAFAGRLARRLRRKKSASRNPTQAVLSPAGAEEPVVSIVIPFFGQGDVTLRCLRSISEVPDSTPFEVILVDDASIDESASVVASVRGVRLIRNPENVGYLRSCNIGAAAARGQHLLLLNNDTEVLPGFLDALVRLLENESVGVVGSKLVYPDGRLQEAGGIIFRDGVGWNYGRGENPSRFEYAFVREVDYCSGASLLVRGDLWRSLGGFDERYSPAYYEDADLCFSARAAGYRVLYQPASVVVHHEGVSHGTETTSGTKRYQEINRHKFIEKWNDVLAEQPARGEGAAAGRDRRRGPKVLVVDHYVPTPDRDAGSLRMYRLLQVLIELGCSVRFLPDNLAYSPRYSEALTQMGVEVFEGPTDIITELRSLGDSLDLIIVSRPQIALRYLPPLRELFPSAFVAYDMVDFQGLREERREQLEGRQDRLSRTYRALELGLVRAADATIAVTEAEAAAVLKEEPDADIVIIPTIHDSPWSSADFSNRRDLLFVGSYAHPPNGDAVLWFVESVLPAVVERLPDVRLRLVGSGMEQAGFTDPSVDVVGWIEDLDDVHDECRIFVAPMRFGAGMKGKVADSIARGLPVVTTSIGAEGIGLDDGVDILVADTAAEFADAVVTLYMDEDLWSNLRRSGGETVRRRFGLDATRGYVRHLLEVAGVEVPAMRS